jgi:transitional endoplasmic reticulum ATPase
VSTMTNTAANSATQMIADAIAMATGGKAANKFKFEDVGIERQGTKIVLPSDPKVMTEEEAIECLNRKIKQDKEEVAVHEEIHAFPMDGAHALMRVLEHRFGWASAAPTPGFFGPNPPTMVNLEYDYGKHTQVIWGGFIIPGIEGQLQTGATWNETDNRPYFVIKGKVKQKYQGEVKEIARLVREYVKDRSIYRGKAIILKTDSDGDVDLNDAPKFMDLSRINEAELVFPAETQVQVETSLFTPVTRTEECRALKIPLKRGILLEGPFGTGKTLTAGVTAKKACANGWTYIYVDRVTGLKEAMIFARAFAPAVVFAEDIDRVLDGDRDVSVDDILNTIDGVESKSQEVITILTTNHIERIEPAMLRPGRLDAVITVKAPDSEAAQRLIRLYSRGLISDKEDLTAAGLELAGQIPAVIREAVERSKLYAISRTQPGETFKLRGVDIANAAKGMKAHMDLIKPKVVEVSDEEALGRALGKVIQGHALNGSKAKIDDMHERVQANLSI